MPGREAFKPFVFVSSTSDLVEERDALKTSLSPQYDAFFYEDEPARDRSARENCRVNIERAHVFVGVLGAEYGSTLPDDEEKRSIVEWEFDTAEKNEKTRFAFRKYDPDDQAVDEDQRRFLAELVDFNSGILCPRYEGTDELVKLVRKSLWSWVMARLQVLGRMQRPLAHWLRRWTRVVTIVAVVAILVACLLGMAEVITTDMAVYACLMGAVVLLACLILAMTEGGGSDA